MNKLYLINSIYDNYKNRILLYFSEDPSSQKYSFVYKDKFNPYFYIDLKFDLAVKLLEEFKGDIKIERYGPEKIKIIAKNYEILQKCSKIISISAYKNIILLDPERQYLLNNQWSYFDIFCLTHENKIKKINNANEIHSAIKKITDNLIDSEKIKICSSLTKKIITSNLLNIKPNTEIPNEQILNMLFENYFYTKGIVLQNHSIISCKKKIEIPNNSYCLDFSNLLPHLIKKDHYNVGYETLNCSCCKPEKIFDINTLPNSLVEVIFLKNGIYFISKDKHFAKEYHNLDSRKENRLIYMHENKIKDLPTGPFFENEKQQIPLIDAISLIESQEVILTHQNNKLNWYCKIQESFISEIITKIINRLKIIEESISISNYLNYSTKVSSELEYNFAYTLYMTEYALLSDLLSEIPTFMTHTNTKFYNPLVSKTIKSIKQEIIIKSCPVQDSPRYSEQQSNQKENIYTTDKNFIAHVNNYFTKINLPIPKLVIS